MNFNKRIELIKSVEKLSYSRLAEMTGIKLDHWKHVLIRNAPATGEDIAALQSLYGSYEMWLGTGKTYPPAYQMSPLYKLTLAETLIENDLLDDNSKLASWCRWSKENIDDLKRIIHAYKGESECTTIHGLPGEYLYYVLQEYWKIPTSKLEARTLEQLFEPIGEIQPVKHKTYLPEDTL